MTPNEMLQDFLIWAGYEGYILHRHEAKDEGAIFTSLQTQRVWEAWRAAINLAIHGIGGGPTHECMSCGCHWRLVDRATWRIYSTPEKPGCAFCCDGDPSKVVRPIGANPDPER